jgi:hypothetical protein
MVAARPNGFIEPRTPTRAVKPPAGPDSPHLLAPKIKARMYFGIAVYGSPHGWCVSDMPLQNGKPIYDMADAERA